MAKRRDVGRYGDGLIGATTSAACSGFTSTKSAPCVPPTHFARSARSPRSPTPQDRSDRTLYSWTATPHPGPRLPGKPAGRGRWAGVTMSAVSCAAPAPGDVQAVVAQRQLGRQPDRSGRGGQVADRAVLQHDPHPDRRSVEPYRDLPRLSGPLDHTRRQRTQGEGTPTLVKRGPTRVVGRPRRRRTRRARRAGSRR